MPTKNPRVNVVLDKDLYRTVHELAQHQGISMSLFMRDLVKGDGGASGGQGISRYSRRKRSEL